MTIVFVELLISVQLNKIIFETNNLIWKSLLIWYFNNKYIDIFIAMYLFSSSIWFFEIEVIIFSELVIL